MASVTRSNRRAEGLHPRPHPHPHPHRHLSAAHHKHPRALSRPPPSLCVSNDGGGRGLQKRTLDAANRDIDAVTPKKTRIAVEILSRQHPPPVHGVGVRTVHSPPVSRSTLVPPVLAKTPMTYKPVPVRTTRSVPLAPPPATPRHSSSAAPGTAPDVPPVSKPEGATKPKPGEQEPGRRKNQSKVVNGIKAELDRLQPRNNNARQQGRKLRSQEAIRFKSELSAYFPDYDEVIGNDPKEQHLLNVETPIVIHDSNPPRSVPDPLRPCATALQQSQSILEESSSIRGYGDSLHVDVFDSQRIDFGFLEMQQNNKKLEDPLPDSLFEPSHKKAERLERSIRNSEKGRAQHEKDQIARLLEDLRGHDWLKVMGVSGVTESKKKSYEPARAYFIKGCQSILEKFRAWNLEEKRRKQEKERALHVAQQAAMTRRREWFQKEANADNDEGQGDEDHQQVRRTKKTDDTAGDDDTEEGRARKGGAGTNSAGVEAIEDSEEVMTSQSDTSDASPAKQLRQEALARSKIAAANVGRAKGRHRSPPPKSSISQPPKEFVSFFSKKYERDNAINRSRRTGRKVLAWGHPIPDIEPADFVLPETFRDEELLKSRARKKRRDKRHGRT